MRESLREVIIGNFLFDLGAAMARLRPDLPIVSINLLQQTPMDKHARIREKNIAEARAA